METLEILTDSRELLEASLQKAEDTEEFLEQYLEAGRQKEEELLAVGHNISALRWTPVITEMYEETIPNLNIVRKNVEVLKKALALVEKRETRERNKVIYESASKCLRWR